MRDALVLACSAVLFAAPAARAYRPFDGTDAAVADRGDLEIELGPAGFLKTGPDRFLVAPDLILNIGFAERWELVLEGHGRFLLDPPPGAASARLADTQLNLKTVVRSGELQDQEGPSVALEAGLLLPTINDEPGVGAQATVIVSRRFTTLTAHLNLGAALSRDKQLELPASLILEGPAAWTVRPVFELFTGFSTPDEWQITALGGLIWRLSDRWALDAGLRGGSVAGEPLFQVRVGVSVAVDVLGGKSQGAVASSGGPAHLPPR